MMHISDWYPTIVQGIAGLKLSLNVTEQHLDGFNVWDSITQSKPSPREEILLQLDPPNYSNPKNPFMGQAAIRVGGWKLIKGRPNCSQAAGPEEIGDPCPSGWVHHNGTIEEPPDNPSFVWLFNLAEDPTERSNLADSHPDIVKELMDKIDRS